MITTISEAPKEKSRFAEIATDILKPIMDKVSEVAFDCFYSDGGKIEPFAVKEGLLEKLDEVIDHLSDQESHYAATSIIGFALGKDGDAPARRFRGMLEVATALRGLIIARKEQVENELAAVVEREKRTAMAERLGFGAFNS